MSVDWNLTSKKILKNLLAERNVSHSELAKLLNAMGVQESKSTIDNKISRGTFSAAFFFQCVTALGATELDLETQGLVSTELPRQSTLKTSTHVWNDRKMNTLYVDTAKTSKKKRRKSAPTVISLFSGAGGLDIGLEQAGFETLVCVDNEADCRATLKHNRPNWHVVDAENQITTAERSNRTPGDIRAIPAEELLEAAGKKKGEVTLVVGGAPCQPFSNIGKKLGKNDERNGDLFLEFVRVVKGVYPQAFIFENVAGITQNRHSDVIGYMKEQFKGLDYGISYGILNAADYGVPQRRERFFMIGIQGVENPAFPLPTYSKDDTSWDLFTRYLDQPINRAPQPWASVQDAFNSLPKNYKKRSDYAVMNVSDTVKERMRLVGHGENFKVLPMEMRPNCWKNGKHLGSDTFGRLVPDAPSVTIRTAAYNPSKGRYIHPFEDRGLDTLEMAALQGFPYDWEFRCLNKDKITLVSGGKQIGNAVPPPLAKELGLAILQQL